MRPKINIVLSRLVKLALIVLFLQSGQACTFSLVQWPFPVSPPPTSPSLLGEPSPTPIPVADVKFEVTLQSPLLVGETLAISILDEVTGLPLNPTNYSMQAKDQVTYTVSLPLVINSVVKYRYILLGSYQSQEDAIGDLPIRYRLYYVTGSGEVKDVVGGWSDRPNAKMTGILQGHLLNADNSVPIPNILVTAGGLQVLTDSAGFFSLYGLPPGTHNFVTFAMDGMYQTFQQGATVANDQVTPIEARLKPAPLVNVTFIVGVPQNMDTGAPVRIAGSLLQLGNTFADLKGGISTIAGRMPVMTLSPDGRQVLSLNLPVGADIRYKYTLGDGFWNAEHKQSGEFQLREFIVPETNIIIQDRVETWQAGPSGPILFELTVPADTPAGDIIYIQFNPYGWTEPIPMWPLGNNHWAYRLYGPLNMLGSFGYRYCRNGQCGTADDVATPGDNTSGLPVTTSLSGQDIQDSVNGWTWLQNTGSTTLTGMTINPKGAGFWAGVEFQPTYHPSWSLYIPQALQNVQALGSNWAILTPGWTYSLSDPLLFSPLPGRDALWTDTILMIAQARALNLNVAVFPVAHFSMASGDWWQNAPRDGVWWQNWFGHYREFALHYADLAAQGGAQALILGGDWLDPAMPNGTLSNGNGSGVPPDAEDRWRAILDEVRGHFNGQVFWAYPYSIIGGLQNAPAFLKDADGVYLLWSARLSGQTTPTKEVLAAEAGRLLDEEMAPFQTSLGKRVILALAYPSASGAATGCLSDGRGGCLDWMALSPPNPDVPSVSLDLQAQADLYEAILIAVNLRDWVGGFVSRGFYPPTILQDKSASVHGKPAADMLWYWFPRMLGVVK